MLLRMLVRPRVLLFLFVFVLVSIIIWQAWSAVAPFALGLVIAYLLLPLVNAVQGLLPPRLHASGVDRPLSIAIIYMLVVLFVVIALWTVVPPIVDQLVSLYENADELYERGNAILDLALAEYRESIPEELQQRFETRLRATDPTTIVNPILEGLFATFGVVGNTLSFMLGLFIIPFWLFFVLNDQGAVVQGALNLIPPDLRADVEALRIIISRVLSAYIRGQLLVAAVIGTATFIGLLILGVPYSILLGIAAGVLALIPFIGPVLGAVPAVVVAFLEAPALALWVVLLFIIIQQVDNIFFSPRIMGAAVALHPALIMVVIVVGSALFGVIGALIAVPTTAALRDVLHYLYIRVGEEQETALEALSRVGYAEYVTPELVEASKVQLVVATEG